MKKLILLSLIFFESVFCSNPSEKIKNEESQSSGSSSSTSTSLPLATILGTSMADLSLIPTFLSPNIVPPPPPAVTEPKEATIHKIYGPSRIKTPFSKSSPLTKNKNLEGRPLSTEEETHTLGLQLIDAVKDSNIAQVKALIEQNINIVNLASDDIGYKALHAAVAINSSKIVNTLLEAGADINAEDNLGKTPLYLAVEKNFVNIVDMLLRAGADFNTVDSNGSTPLHVAAQQGLSKIAKILLTFNPHHKTDNYGATPLYYAIEKKSQDTVLALLKASVNIHVPTDKNGSTALHTAINIDSLEIVKILLHAGASVNTPDNAGFTPLHLAAKNNSWNFLEILLNANANVYAVDYTGFTPFHWAAQKNCFKVIRIFLNSGFDANVRAENGFTPLQCAVEQNCVQSALLLILHGADVNAIIGDSFMSLETPIDAELIKGARSLLISGEQLGSIRHIFPRIIPTIKAIAPGSIAQAVILGDKELLRAQLKTIPEKVKSASKEIQATLREQSKSKRSPALVKKYNNILNEQRKIISDHSNQPYPDINLQDMYGWTALHWAMAQHDVFSVLALLEAGADVTLCTRAEDDNNPYRYMTPLDIARYNYQDPEQYNNHKNHEAWQQVIDAQESYFNNAAPQLSSEVG
jgi:ankyrin repeat protein